MAVVRMAETKERAPIKLQIGQDADGSWYWQCEDELGCVREGAYESFAAAWSWAQFHMKRAFDPLGRRV